MTLSPSVERDITIAFGRNREDRNWRNATSKVSHLIDLLREHTRGDKDGQCILQGRLVGVQRQAKDVLSCDLMMFDCDTGEHPEDVYGILQSTGLFAVMWSTHSHMKNTTTIGEWALTTYLRKHRLEHADPIDAVKQYLRTEKRVQPWLLDTITEVRREHLPGGVSHTVHHAPMPRFRILFVLDKPYVFAERGASQADAIQEWKELYAGMSDQLGVAHDRSCVDPSRLMYLPRIAPLADISEHFVWIINEEDGVPLDVNTVERVTTTSAAADAHDPFIALGAEKLNVQTAGLLRFVKNHGDTFAAAEWLRAVAPEDVIHDTGEKLAFRCPNEDAHSVISPDDTAFVAIDGNGATGFWMGCQHETCKGASNGDRVWYLDRLCRKYDQTVEDLLPFCDETAVEVPAPELVDTADMTLDEYIDSLTPEHPAQKSAAERATIYNRIIADVEDGEDRLSRVETMLNKLRIKGSARTAALKSFKSLVVQYAGAAEDTNADANNHAPVPEHGADCSHIWDHWPASDQARILDDRMYAVNHKDPTIFNRVAEGSACRLRKGQHGYALEDVATREQWSFEIARCVRFKRYVQLTNTEKEINTPEWAVTHMKGGGHYVFPYIDRIVNVPVFSPEGALMTTPGYHPSIQMYLDPAVTYEKLPKDITEEWVEWARGFLFEALRDFPFSDAFDAVEPLPVRDGTEDENGYPLPTAGRGTSSYAHTVAMILQPFVRNMIVGPCPAYFIDKSAPGTGAGLLMDVLTYIFMGTSAPVQTLQKGPHVEDEFRKRVTSMLRSRTDVVFFDNINFDVDSGTLAAALTAGIWRDRILGRTEDGEFPIRCVWTLAGNNVGFSRELMRRLVPIRMDAATPDPAADRPVSFYTHYPLDEWLQYNRISLVLACHVLVANWVQRGRVPYTDNALQSFSSWSNVLGGILRDAGIPGFLSSLPAFNDAKNEDTFTGENMIAALYKEYGNKTWRPLDAVRDIGNNPMEENPFEALGMDVSDETRLSCTFGHWLKRNAIGRTFKLEDQRMTLVKRRSGDGMFYQLLQANV